MDMMKTKPGQGVGHKSPKPKKIRLPKWWAELKLEPRWQELWDQLHQETPEQLRKRVMGQVSIIEHEREKGASRWESWQAAWQAEKQDLQKQIADLEDRIRRGRQNSIYGLMNGISNCLEGNARAVHALAEPMQEVLAQLAKDMAQDRQGYVHNSRFDRGKILGVDRESSWPQPPDKGQR